jgi:hypothetical protein
MPSASVGEVTHGRAAGNADDTASNSKDETDCGW